MNCDKLLILFYVQCSPGILSDISVYRLKLQNFENVKIVTQTQSSNLKF